MPIALLAGLGVMVATQRLSRRTPPVWIALRVEVREKDR